jgi:hypothetical protein
MGLLRSYNPLVYPGGRARPGFDPSHPASSGVINGNGFSGIASGANFVNLLNGAKGTPANGPTSTLDGRIGPSAVFTATGAQATYSTPLAVVNNSTTSAAILVCSAFNAGGGTWFIHGTFVGHYNGFGITSAGALQAYDKDGGSKSSTFSLSLNVPYLIIVSKNSATVNFLAVRLDNGSLQTSTASGFTTVSVSDGLYTIGCFAGSSGQIDASMATCMYGTSYLSMPQMLAWASDPWSFWYPPKVSNLIFSSVANPSSNVLIPPPVLFSQICL